MAASLEILLPLHVRSSRILLVMGKLAGVPWSYSTHFNANAQGLLTDTNGHAGDEPGFCTQQPASPTNDWHIRFLEKRKEVFGFTSLGNGISEEISSAYLNFPDVAGTPHCWYFFQETEYENGKLLAADVTPLYVALGQRLVMFFGGNISIGGIVLFEAPSPPDNQGTDLSSDDRWYMFFNALNQTPLLTPQEIQAAARLTAAPPCRKDEAILEAYALAQAQERRQTLEKQVDNSPPHAPFLKPRF